MTLRFDIALAKCTVPSLPSWRLPERPKVRIDWPLLRGDDLVTDIQAAIAELPTYGYQ